MKIKLVLSLVLLLLVLLFSFQNAAVVQVRFLGWNLDLSLALLIFASFACGILAGWGFTSFARWRAKP